ncbi:MAG: hypothetical protein ACFFCW_42985, partial [Candidatus Hodarchaeota archaeon]
NPMKPTLLSFKMRVGITLGTLFYKNGIDIIHTQGDKSSLCISSSSLLKRIYLWQSAICDMYEDMRSRQLAEMKKIIP